MKCKNCNENDAVKYSKYSNGKFCGKKCARAFSTKEKRKEINEKVSKKLSKHLYKNLVCIICGSNFQNIHYYYRGTCSAECYRQLLSIKAKKRIVLDDTRKKLSTIAKQRNFGHTSKQAVYYKMKNGDVIYLHSSYEEKTANSLDENNIKWIRPKPLRYIGKDEKEHRYYPDFYLSDFDTYIDTKNDYLIKKDADKIKRVSDQNKVMVLIIDRNNLEWDNIRQRI